MEHRIVRNEYSLIFKLIFIVLSSLICFFNYNKTTSVFIAVLLLIISIYNVIRSAVNWKLLITNVFIAYFNYSICIANYIFPIDNYFTSWRDRDVSVFAISVLFIFNVVYTAFLKIEKTSAKTDFFKDSPNNGIIVLGGICLLIVIFIVGFGRPDVDGERGAPSTLYEYSIILFIIVFYYCKTKGEKIIVSVIMAAYALQNLMFGGRATALQLIIAWIIIFILDRYSLKQMIVPMLALLILFTAVGEFRASFDLSGESLMQSFSNLIKGKFVNDTSYSAYFTSLTYIEYADKISFASRLSLFGNFLLSMLLGGTAVDGSNLATITRQYFVHYYGGVLPFFGYFYLGWAGVAGLGIYVSGLMNRFVCGVKSCTTGLSKCLAVYLVSSCPRWYLYSPSQLIRGILLLCLVYGICRAFHRLVTRT